MNTSSTGAAKNTVTSSRMIVRISWPRPKRFLLYLYACLYAIVVHSSLRIVDQNSALSGAILRTVQLANSISSRPTTDWKKEVAAVNPKLEFLKIWFST